MGLIKYYKKASLKKRVLIGMTIVGGLYISIMAIYLAWYGMNFNTNFTIFADISECEAIDANLPEDATIEVYDTPFKDQDINDLPYAAFYGRKIKCSKFSFEIFAYEFADKESRHQYLKNITENENYDEESSFHCSTGHPAVLIVHDGERVYQVFASNNDMSDVVTYLEKCFSLYIRDIIHAEHNPTEVPSIS